MRGCVDLSHPPNGDVFFTGITIGSKAYYDCNVGYNLVGNDTRDCVESGMGMGMWTDMEPQCIGMRMRLWVRTYTNMRTHACVRFKVAD